MGGEEEKWQAQEIGAEETETSSNIFISLRARASSKDDPEDLGATLEEVGELECTWADAVYGPRLRGQE